MLRSARHAKILEIISHKEIETQEELCEELNKLNHVVTQATISRDIKDLHLFKVAGTEKKYRYTYISGVEGEISPKMKSLFRDCVVSIKSAQNIVVIKTLVGNGANAGAVVDKLNYNEIIGSVAGDDTLLVVCVDTPSAEGVVQKIKDFIKSPYGLIITISWIALILCLIIKLFGGHWFELWLNNDKFISFCEFVDNTQWFKMILACIICVATTVPVYIIMLNDNKPKLYILIINYE